MIFNNKRHRYQSYSHASNLSQFSRHLWSDGCATHVTEHVDTGVGKIVNLPFHIVSRGDYLWSSLFYAQTHLSRLWYVTYSTSDGIREKDASKIADWFAMVSHLTTSDVEGIIHMYVNLHVGYALTEAVCVRWRGNKPKWHFDNCWIITSSD